MAGFSSAVDWAGEHPVTVAVGAFAVGAVLLLMFSRGGGGDNGMSAFYAAQAAQAASGNSLAATQDNNKTALGIAQVAADRDKAVAGISSDTTLGVANYATQVDLAKYTTAQQSQRQQFFLAVGQQQIQGQSMPFLIDLARQGGDQAKAAAAFGLMLEQGATYYTPSHG